jgi:hypothetical protein
MQTRAPESKERGPDAVTLEVYRHLFTALAEEMGASLRRASFSPNIKERRDYSCALFDADGVAVALGDHMPVHLGAMPMSVEAALTAVGSLAPGDVVFVHKTGLAHWTEKLVQAIAPLNAILQPLGSASAECAPKLITLAP